MGTQRRRLTLSQQDIKIKAMMRDEKPKGTPLWMAPEVLLHRNFNEKCDVYRYAKSLPVIFLLTRHCTVSD